MTAPLHTIASLCDVPDGAMPSEAVIVLGLIDADGDSAIRVLTLGDPHVTEALGLLAVASHQFALNALEAE